MDTLNRVIDEIDNTKTLDTILLEQETADFLALSFYFDAPELVPIYFRDLSNIEINALYNLIQKGETGVKSTDLLDELVRELQPGIIYPSAVVSKLNSRFRPDENTSVVRAEIVKTGKSKNTRYFLKLF